VSIPVRLPSASDDRPRLVLLAVIALLCAAIGIAIARWGTGERHATRGLAAPATSPRTSRSGERAARADAPVVSIDERAAADIDSRAVDADGGSETEAEVASPPPASAPVEVSPSARGPLGEDTAPRDHIAPAAPVERPVREPTKTAPPPRARPRSSATVTRGRVAYLRCEGLPQRPGPVPCPRDEALETSAWEVIDRLPTCEALPADVRGEADLVIALVPGSATDVRARDRFAPEVVRADAAAILGCLATDLARIEQHLGSSHLVVSFRFALR
jgi:hypothetical protein